MSGIDWSETKGAIRALYRQVDKDDGSLTAVVICALSVSPEGQMNWGIHTNGMPMHLLAAKELVDGRILPIAVQLAAPPPPAQPEPIAGLDTEEAAP